MKGEANPTGDEYSDGGYVEMQHHLIINSSNNQLSINSHTHSL